MLLGRKPLGTVAYLGGLPAVLETFTWSWGQMIQHTAEHCCDERYYVHWARTLFSEHAAARNNLVSEFLGDWLIQLDTDHVFDADLVERLIWSANTHGCDVLTGVYQFKQPPYAPVLYQWVNGFPAVMSAWDPKVRLLQIGSAGAGCLFIRRKVFDRIVDELKEQPFSKLPNLSEDHSFFKRCQQLDIKCYADMTIESRHLRVSGVALSDFTMVQGVPLEVGGFGRG